MLEGIPAIVLFGPLLFPIARQVGVNEVHYSMVVILAWASACSPALRGGLLRGLRHQPCEPGRGMKPIIGYVLAMLVGLIIVAAPCHGFQPASSDRRGQSADM